MSERMDVEVVFAVERQAMHVVRRRGRHRDRLARRGLRGLGDTRGEQHRGYCNENESHSSTFTPPTRKVNPT